MVSVNATPIDIFLGLYAFGESLFHIGLGFFYKIFQSILFGAALVLPFFILIRLFKRFR